LAYEDKLSLHQHITGCYGSLTTFNVLFKEDGDKFSGVKDPKETKEEKPIKTEQK